ncbi:MAG: nuclear transport factor 2 family protein [Actinomycetota bacterium]
MSELQSLSTIERMTKAVFSNDRATLEDVFAPDLSFHVRGPLPKPGDHAGLTGFLGVLGTIFELTGGEVEIEQLFCIADGPWAAEWEHAVLRRNGRTLEMNNAFVYRFDDGRIAEMWMIAAAPPSVAAFWD